MSSSDFITILAAVVVVLIAGVTGLATYLSSRRSASGRVETSEAAILWQQSQDMRTMLADEKAKAEEQRDRLIKSYTEQVLPMLTGIASLVGEVSTAVAEGVAIVRSIQAELGGGEHGVAHQAHPAEQARED